MKCEKCGGNLLPSDHSCPRCGQRVTATSAGGKEPSRSFEDSPIRIAPNQLGGTGSPARIPPVPSPPPVAPRGLTPARSGQSADSHMREKVLCSRCMDSFRDIQMYELGGKRYCERCFHIVVGDKDALPPQELHTRVEIAAPPAPPTRIGRYLHVAFRVAWIVLIIGFIVAVIIMMQPRPKTIRVTEFDALPTFRPSSPIHRSQGDPLPESPSPPKPKTESPSPEPSTLPPIDFPIVKGTTAAACPVCSLKFSLLQPSRTITCPNCQRQLRIVEYDLRPAITYVGRQDDAAIIHLGDQERCVELNQEVSPHTGVFLERFQADGALFVKTQIISFTEYRISPAKKVENLLRLEKLVPKCRDEETTELVVVQGTPAITCDGRGTKAVYHSNPLEIKMDASEPHTFTVLCPLPSCWKQFTVTVRGAPAIEMAVAPGTDEVPCPVCGFVRHLTDVQSPTTFCCLNCKRAVRLTVVPLTEIKFRGIENGAALIEHSGQSYAVSPGKEAWPGSQIILASLLEDGRAEFKRTQRLTFQDYRTSPPSQRQAEVPITWRLSKAPNAP